MTNDRFIEKALKLKRELKKRTGTPLRCVEFYHDENAFQKVGVRSAETTSPVTLMSGDSVVYDFGGHCVGYLKLNIRCVGDNISDSPVRLKFSLGEFPLEMTALHSEYNGLLGSGWLQYEEKTAVFTPCEISLDRRYSFRYMRIERTDNAPYPIVVDDIVAECVSAVSLNDAEEYCAPDERLQKIYDMSVKTLCECEQDVFEDGPKRDRRLWIGDLRLQALTDYVTIKNTDLVKRCIYLFAGYLNSNGEVAPCVYPDCPPYRLEWTFADYSLFLITCLYDYKRFTGDSALASELYDIAFSQAKKVSERLNVNLSKTADGTFIDWCPRLDKSVAVLGVYAYCLRQLAELKADEWIDSELEKIGEILLSMRNDDGIFVTPSGQISQHSQVWAVLSGFLDKDESAKLLGGIEALDTEYTFRTPYMRHYYIEALCMAGLEDKAIDDIKDFWGRIADAGLIAVLKYSTPITNLNHLIMLRK